VQTNFRMVDHTPGGKPGAGSPAGSSQGTPFASALRLIRGKLSPL
jgi:hypothetical protein